MAFGQGIVAAVIRVLIDADTKNLNTGLQTAEQRTRAFADTLSTAGSKMQAMGTRMTAMVTLPIVGGFAAAFNAASDFNESMSKATVVFGEQADEIRAWSKTSATAFGMSQQAALEAVGTFGNFMQAMGLAADDSAVMSKRLVELAADLASFNNASPEDVLLALRSGLAGEVEPLRKFGVSLSAARVEAEAMNLGIEKSYTEMSAAEKAAISYSIILEDTKLAQGDFARTSDGAANQMRILKAELMDSAAKIGRRLIPIGLDLLKMVRGWIDSFQKMSKSSQETLIQLLAFAAATGPLMKMAGVFLSIAGSIAKVSAAIQGARTAAALAAGAQGVASAGGAAAAAGGAAGMAGLLPAAAIAALVAAVIAGIKAHHDYKNSIEDNVKSVRKFRGSLLGVSREQLGLSVSTNDLSGGQKTLEDTLAQYRRQQEMTVRNFTWLNPATENYTKLLLKNNGLNQTQSEKLAALISGTEIMGGKMDDLTLKQISNLVAVGDVTGALKLLKRAARDASTYLSGLPGALEDPRVGIDQSGIRERAARSGGDTVIKIVIDRKLIARQQDYVLRASGL